MNWPAAIDVEAAAAAFQDVSWLGRVVDAPEESQDARRIATNLELPIRDGSASGPVRKAAFIDLGRAAVVENGIHLAVAWRSATLAPLFPVFAGELRVSAAGLTLDGSYTPPFGPVGLVIDAVLLNLIARRTGHAFLTRLADHLAPE